MLPISHYRYSTSADGSRVLARDTSIVLGVIDMKARDCAKAVAAIRSQGVGKKDMPASWVQIFFVVADAGNNGVLTTELIREMKMSGPVLSVILKKMSLYPGSDGGKIEGPDLFNSAKDLKHRARQRVFLSEKGRLLASGLGIGI